MAFPPTSTEPFVCLSKDHKRDAELYAEGFVLEFRLTGQEFKIDIDLPSHAEHGQYMIIFYTSFYSKSQPGSIVETGLSFSGVKGWNFTDDVGGKGYDHIVHADLKGRKLELVVAFKPLRHGGLVESKLNGIVNNVKVNHHEAINKMRLVIATGNRHKASYSEAGMTLRSVDGKPPKTSGFLKWQKGHKIADGDHRSVLVSATPFGMRCSLPPEKKPVSEKHPSDPKPEIDKPYVPTRPLSQTELRNMWMMR